MAEPTRRDGAVVISARIVILDRPYPVERCECCGCPLVLFDLCGAVGEWSGSGPCEPTCRGHLGSSGPGATWFEVHDLSWTAEAGLFAHTPARCRDRR